MSAQNADISKYVMYFPFDGDIADASGNGITLTPKGGAGTPGAFLTMNKKFGTNAVNWKKKPMVTTNSTFDKNESYSAATWVNFNDVTGSRKIVSQQGGLIMQLNGGLIKVGYGDGSINSTITPAGDNTWHHIALTVDRASVPTVATLYVDGVVIGTNTPNAVQAPIITPISMGIIHNQVAAAHVTALDAFLDDFVLTTEVLTPSMINDIIANGAATGGLVLSTNDFSKKAATFKAFKMSNDVLVVRSSTAFDSYKVISLFGQELKSGTLKNNSINVSGMAKGIYIVSLSDNNGLTVSKKIVL